jgi:hypothetical protein
MLAAQVSQSSSRLAGLCLTFHNTFESGLPTCNLAVLQAKDAGGSGAEQLPRKLHISKLTRNVTEEHVREIFAHYGNITTCQLAIDERVQLSKGYAGEAGACAAAAGSSSCVTAQKPAAGAAAAAAVAAMPV